VAAADERPLMTRQDVAARFRVHVRTVDEWARQGRLKTIHTPGGQRRFRPEDVDRFTDEQEDESNDEDADGRAAVA
jgi:excisionase family DNA binding protein